MSKFKFIIDFNDYINNIDNKSNIDDVKLYNESKNEIIVEGLLKTYPINKSINIIKKRFPYLDITLSDDNDIFIEGDFLELFNYIPLINNLGYFISTVTLDGSTWIKTFDENIKPLCIIIEAKYDIEILPLPKILYHTSPSIYDKKILNIGLIPKSKNKLSVHPERIYLTSDLNDAKSFGNYIKQNDKHDYSIFEIDTTNLDIRLFEDINYRNGGYYTLNNISKQYLKKIF